MNRARTLTGKAIVPGVAEGEVLVSTEPLSFWGGYSGQTGEIIDRRHPLSGQNAAGKILVLPFTRGSSTTTAIFLESVRAGVAPAGLVMDRPDVFLTLASVVAEEMYGQIVPIVALDAAEFASLESGAHLRIENETLHVT
jgi:predicted aconitase with swiveling domain